MAKKTIEEKYTELSEVEHILKRPGMWIGSIKEEERECFIYDNEEEKMTMKEISYSPAMLKLFDEVLSNSCDEYRRKDNLGLTEISVTIDRYNKSITVYDNGGIPVVKHKAAKVYVPEFIFGQLRTSSNYDDTEDRNVIGTNGVGSSITNIFSKNFTVTTADKKNLMTVIWKNNMSKKNVGNIIPKKSHFTSVTFELDFDRFDVKEKGFTDDFIDIVEKRCIDAAAANPGLKVKFTYDDDGNGGIQRESEWKFKNFEEYMELYSDYYDESTVISLKDKTKQIWICPDSAIDVAFVNGAECSKGTHIKAVRTPISKAIAETLKKKNKIELTSKSIDAKYGIFGLFDISNPSYNSQTKEELTTPQENFYKDPTVKFDIPDSFISKCQKSEIVNLVIDWYQQKVDADNQKEIRKLNKQAKKLFRSDKFIDCNSKKKEERQLWLFEGDSAKSGFRINRDPQTQAGYIMRGVPKNSEGLNPVQVMKNEVFADIVNILGLQWGEYNDKEKIAYHKIVICSDMDHDGSKIASLLLVFFNHFPELFEQNMICRSISPIIVARKGNDEKKYFTLEDYKKDEAKLKGYKVIYNKGLGGLDNSLYKQMMREPIFHYFSKDDLADRMLRKWFAKGIADERKSMLKETVEA
jgi:DNA topoisomerase-2